MRPELINIIVVIRLTIQILMFFSSHEHERCNKTIEITIDKICFLSCSGKPQTGLILCKNSVINILITSFARA